MITINDIFSQIFPWIEGISNDVGTILISLVFFSIFIYGFHLVMLMLSMRTNQHDKKDTSDTLYGSDNQDGSLRSNNFKNRSFNINKKSEY